MFLLTFTGNSFLMII